MEIATPLALKRFIESLTKAVEGDTTESVVVGKAREALAKLLAERDWLDPIYQEPGDPYYRQYLLYRDPLDRFSVQSFVWGPGQSTPVHDHTVWGLVGVYQGAEKCQRYRRLASGEVIPDGDEQILVAGQIDYVSPSVGDIHTVRNAHDDRVSISIHVYGADIGKVERHVFDLKTGAVKPFVSGYSTPRALS